MRFVNPGSPRLMAIYAGLASLVFLALVATAGAPLTDRLSSLMFDEFQRIKPREPGGAPIAVVDIDQQSLEQLGQWPWPRSQIAELTNRLGSLGAAAIAFDMTFSEPDRTSPSRTVETLREMGADITFPEESFQLDNDILFASELARHPTVMGFALTNELVSSMPKPKSGFSWGGRDPKTILPPYRGSLDNLPQFDEAASGLGFFSYRETFDGVIRQAPLIGSSGDALYPSLSLEALRVAQQASSIDIKSTGASGELDTGNPAIVSVRAGGFEAETDEVGQIRIYYSGHAADNTLSAKDLLDDSIDSATLENRVYGHIVLIGTSAVGLRDLRITPFGPGVPGVNIHAEIIDQVMSGTFLRRPDVMRGVESGLALVITLVLVVTLRPGRFVIGGAFSMVLATGTLGLSWYLFSERLLLFDPTLPLLATATVYFAITLTQYLGSEREKRFIRNAFGHYLAPALVDRLSDDPKALNLGGETRELTLLFSDIRGFTSLSESLDPEELTTLLNNFLTPMTDELLKSGATIDKYMGDAIMAFWNAPLPLENHRASALDAAVQMMHRLDMLNAESGYNIRIGIGLNTGESLVGNLGSSQRFSYSAIGDAVNVASRIEGITKYYGICLLFEQSVLGESAALPAHHRALEVDLVRVVGRDTPLVLYTLVDMRELHDDTDFFETHAAFLTAYRNGEFPAALQAVERLADSAPGPIIPLYKTFRERLSELIANPPAQWDGTFDFTDK